MTDKTLCPLCKATLDLVPHPSKPGRLIAVCDCRGKKVAVVEVNKPIKSSFSKPLKEREE